MLDSAGSVRYLETRRAPDEMVRWEGSRSRAEAREHQGEAWEWIGPPSRVGILPDRRASSTRRHVLGAARP